MVEGVKPGLYSLKVTQVFKILLLWATQITTQIITWQVRIPEFLSGSCLVLRYWRWCPLWTVCEGRQVWLLLTHCESFSGLGAIYPVKAAVGLRESPETPLILTEVKNVVIVHFIFQSHSSCFLLLVHHLVKELDSFSCTWWTASPFSMCGPCLDLSLFEV